MIGTSSEITSTYLRHLAPKTSIMVKETFAQADELDPMAEGSYSSFETESSPSIVPLRFIDYAALAADPTLLYGSARDEAAIKRKEALAALEDAVHNVGFFYLKNFLIPTELLRDMWALGREIFAMTTEEKQKYAIPRPGDTYGWKAQGSEVVDSKGTVDGHEQVL
ncbi:hypothetical protein HDU93_003451 [Gonapodya sp. JEL0774]|nr:hypothetical protein HDU93_003451 [Gonapodya sp. JEL0774]